jgi:hypothetical protein
MRLPKRQWGRAGHLLQFDRHTANLRPDSVSDRASVDHSYSAADYSTYRDHIMRARAGAQSAHQSVRMAKRLPMTLGAP